MFCHKTAKKRKRYFAVLEMTLAKMANNRKRGCSPPPKAPYHTRGCSPLCFIFARANASQRRETALLQPSSPFRLRRAKSDKAFNEARLCRMKRHCRAMKRTGGA